MLLSVFVLAVVGVVVWSFAPDRGRRRRVVRAIGGASLALAGVMLVLLVFFREPTCTALGGTWNDGHCRNEWGGNGNNDGSNRPFG